LENATISVLIATKSASLCLRGKVDASVYTGYSGFLFGFPMTGKSTNNWTSMDHQLLLKLIGAVNETRENSLLNGKAVPPFRLLQHTHSCDYGSNGRGKPGHSVCYAVRCLRKDVAFVTRILVAAVAERLLGFPYCTVAQLVFIPQTKWYDLDAPARTSLADDQAAMSSTYTRVLIPGIKNIEMKCIPEGRSKTVKQAFLQMLSMFPDDVLDCQRGEFLFA
jgi:hypothetical protein